MNWIVKRVLGVASVLGVLLCGARIGVWVFVQPLMKDVRVDSTRAHVQRIAKAIEQYRQARGALPVSLADVVDEQLLETDEFPTDAWANPIVYEPGEHGASFELLADLR